MARAYTTLLLIAAMTVTAAARSPRQKGHGGHVATRNRLVAEYINLETQLAVAAQKGDSAKLAQLLADDFEQWSPEPPGDPIPREDWIAGYRPASFSTSQLAVRDLGDTEVASFILHQKGTFADKELAGDFFVVDVWRREGNRSRLVARYVTRSPRAPAAATAASKR